MVSGRLKEVVPANRSQGTIYQQLSFTASSRQTIKRAFYQRSKTPPLLLAKLRLLSKGMRLLLPLLLPASVFIQQPENTGGDFLSCGRCNENRGYQGRQDASHNHLQPVASYHGVPWMHGIIKPVIP